MKYDWSQRLLHWYDKNKRDLPWRGVDDAYKVWLSEVILQQTRIDQGTAYYHRFIENFPTVSALANADESTVLRLWQGLGYYSRARSLHHTAKVVYSDYSGRFPTSYEQLIKLKGIGPYTAAAIASISGGQDVLAIDGNVYRVLSRAFDIDADIAEPKTRKLFDDAGRGLLPKGRAGDFNQALMDLGATVCTSRKPDCIRCPVNEDCLARIGSKQHLLPVKSKNVKNRVRYFNFLYLRDQEGVYMRPRDDKDIWAGLWDFPLLETSQDLDWSGLIDTNKAPILDFLVKAGQPMMSHIANKHQLTHQTILARFHVFNITNGYRELKDYLNETGYQLLDATAMDSIGKPVLILNFLKQLGA